MTTTRKLPIATRVQLTTPRGVITCAAASCQNASVTAASCQHYTLYTTCCSAGGDFSSVTLGTLPSHLCCQHTICSSTGSARAAAASWQATQYVRQTFGLLFMGVRLRLLHEATLIASASSKAQPGSTHSVVACTVTAGSMTSGSATELAVA